MICARPIPFGVVDGVMTNLHCYNCDEFLFAIPTKDWLIHEAAKAA